ncbi:PREDICTED: pulmonary surfactant-associated protein D [Calidris pugnax]|uniref:pulmonary surfactant-associated protein D n=1 Tax=Calidris pugnax TaxID=198806 RepID=UPI00071DC4A5|nr:PREDICTED: pulmonary surfactant-associated protein D [Calidris pugnax]
MLSYSSYTLTAVAALLVTCCALPECPGIPEPPGTPGLPGKDGLKGQERLTGLTRPSGNFLGPLRRDRLPWSQGVPVSLDSELHNVLVNLKPRLCRLEGVLALNEKIKVGGEKIFASNGKEVDFASALKSCEEAGGTLATPMNEEENKAIMGIVKQYNRYAYLGFTESRVSGQFQYLNGVPLNYTKWHNYEPNGKGTEKCVEMYTDGSWNDKKCNMRRLTICEF